MLPAFRCDAASKPSAPINSSNGEPGSGIAVPRVVTLTLRLSIAHDSSLRSWLPTPKMKNSIVTDEAVWAKFAKVGSAPKL